MEYVSKPEMASAHPTPEQLFKTPTVREVSPAAIATWLGKGWHDLMQNPVASLAYGIIFSLVGIAMAMLYRAEPAFVFAAFTGFFLAGPFLALGLYALSREAEQGRKPRLFPSFFVIKENIVSLGFYAVVLAMLLIFWVRVASLVVGLFFHGINVTDMGYVGLWNALMAMPNGLAFLATFFGVGLLFAVFAFVTGVVTAPMLLDRKVDIVTALVTSIRAVFKNPVTMLLWAITIVVVVGLGIATFNIGLIIAMPLIAHATWHAYRDLVV